MKRTFETTSCIPFDFEGECYLWQHSRRWYKKGKLLHRENGPAVEFDNGTKYWLINNQYHRLDGPAIEMNDYDTKLYYINNKRLTTEDYWNHPLVIEYKLKHILETC